MPELGLLPDAVEPPAVEVAAFDFDGTLAGEDFYNLFVSRLYPPGAPDYWSECVAGRITHFEALRNIFAYVPVGEAAPPSSQPCPSARGWRPRWERGPSQAQ